MRFAGTELASYLNPMDHSAIAGESQKGRTLERRAVMMGEGMVANAGMQSIAKTKSAEYQADAIKAGGQAAGQSAMASGIGSLASGLAGGISKLAGGGGAAPVGVARTSPSVGIAGSVAPAYNGVSRPYFGPAF